MQGAPASDGLAGEGAFPDDSDWASAGWERVQEDYGLPVREAEAQAASASDGLAGKGAFPDDPDWASADWERAQESGSPDDSVQAADDRAPDGRGQASDEAATCFLQQHCRGWLQKPPPEARGQKIPKAAKQTERACFSSKLIPFFWQRTLTDSPSFRR